MNVIFKIFRGIKLLKEDIKEEFTKMSVNAISSISLYEYYFAINKEKEKKSPLLEEMKKYGLEPTDNEAVNIVMLEKAREQERARNNQETEEKETATNRPWADIMYQLNISFNEDPLDDIKDIKEELKSLLSGIEDKELESEIADLENYVEKLYISYSKNSITSGVVLTSQLNNLSMVNKASLL